MFGKENFVSNFAVISPGLNAHQRLQGVRQLPDLRLQLLRLRAQRLGPLPDAGLRRRLVRQGLLAQRRQVQLRGREGKRLIGVKDQQRPRSPEISPGRTSSADEKKRNDGDGDANATNTGGKAPPPLLSQSPTPKLVQARGEHLGEKKEWPLNGTRGDVRGRKCSKIGPSFSAFIRCIWQQKAGGH